MSSVAIIGGGISGLSTAYYLSKAGIPSTLIEARPRLGGVIQTERIQNCVVEGGPDSFLAAKPWAMDLIRELGLESEVIGSNDHQRKTFIRRNGRMVEIPDGLQFLVPTKILPMAASPLMSWPAKLRMALEWLRRPPAKSDHDRSVSEFVEEHYGREAVDYLAEPLLAGIYGGDPAKLSMRSVLPRFGECSRPGEDMGASARDNGYVHIVGEHLGRWAQPVQSKSHSGNRALRGPRIESNAGIQVLPRRRTGIEEYFTYSADGRQHCSHFRRFG